MTDTLPTGATIDPSGRRLITSSWELVLTPGTAGTPPTFTCTGTTSALALTDLGTTGADAVYSLRRVSIDHTGPVVRVRRSTDNTVGGGAGAPSTGSTRTSVPSSRHVTVTSTMSATGRPSASSTAVGSPPRGTPSAAASSAGSV